MSDHAIDLLLHDYCITNDKRKGKNCKSNKYTFSVSCDLLVLTNFTKEGFFKQIKQYCSAKQF